MTSYYPHHHYPQPLRQPATPPQASAIPVRNPNPFDPNIYIPSPGGSSFPENYTRKEQGLDYADDLAQLMKSQQVTVPSNVPSTPYDDFSRPPPHNIFDVSVHQPSNHPASFGSPYGVSVPSSSQYRSTSHHGPESPFTTESPFSARSDGGFNQHAPLPSPLPPLNINGHHPPVADDLVHSPFGHHPPPLSAVEHHRSSSPFSTSRSRSRSKPPLNTASLPTNRSRMAKKRASVSGIDRPHPSAITIPGGESRPGTSSGSAPPMSAHTMGWPAFSLPTPDSVSNHGFGSFVDSPVVPKKEDSPDLDNVTKQAAMANEKRRRRRESHNAVERRRRDNINEKISELATLIPECLLDAGTGSSKEMGIDVFATTPGGIGDDDKEPQIIKANKGMILKKSVDYIRYLQQLVTAQANRNRDLEAQVHHLKGRANMGDSPSISSPQSTDSTTDIGNQNFHVFGEDLIGGISGMGMVDILHSLAPENGEPYITMDQFGKGVVKSPSAKGFDGLETLHEHTNGDHDRGPHDVDHDMEMVETSPSASADSPPLDRAAAEAEEVERGRARVRSRKQDYPGGSVEVKTESPAGY